MLRSSDELLLQIKDLLVQLGEQLVSMDMESLFTNVPVTEAIDIIFQTTYNHPMLPPPSMVAATLKKRFSICTTETPFQFCGRTYVQVDGVSMGSPSCPTFADFYMSHLKNAVLLVDKIPNPVFYWRYVNDILDIFPNRRHIVHFEAQTSKWIRS